MLSFGLQPLSEPLQTPKCQRLFILGGNAGTAQTISKMQELVTVGKREEAIRILVGELAFQCPAKDYYCYVEAAHNFCRDQIRYVFDPSGVELLENPARILKTRAADCDSICILMASICESMGFPCRFVTIKADKQRPDDFSHVFLEVQIPKHGWVGSDPTQPEKPFGWQAGPEYPRKNWPASKDEPEGEDTHETDEMAGIGLGYQNAPIPGVESTVGVMVEKPFEFRVESALLTASPEQLELSAVNSFKTDAGQTMQSHSQEFFYPRQAQQMFTEEIETAKCPAIVVKKSSNLKALPAPVNGNYSLLWLAGAGILAYLLWGRK